MHYDCGVYKKKVKLKLNYIIGSNKFLVSISISKFVFSPSTISNNDHLNILYHHFFSLFLS